jgi:hypothetical protein
VDKAVASAMAMGMDVEQFEFTVATLVRKQTGLLFKRVMWEVERRSGIAWRSVERLADELSLEVVLIRSDETQK